MRLRSLTVLTLVAATFAGAPPAIASDVQPKPPDAEQADRALLYRLIRQVRRIDRDQEQLMSQAMTEARDREGNVNAETKARLLSMRDERDRLFARMHVLSMRYGWEIPQFDKPTVETSSREQAEDSVFGAVDAMIRQRFTAEAERIAGMVKLPVVSLESMG